jgi:hypothetical protein
MAEMNLPDIESILSYSTDYAFFLASHRTFPKTDHILVYKETHQRNSK